jgi:choline dehydrogenase-like flavoprotein
MLFGWDEFSPEDSQEILWDAVIIGAGMGGATLGYALARKGLKVLFLERGSAQTLFPESLDEGRLKRLLGWERREERLAAMGRWPRPITMMRGGQAIHFLAPIGSGPGGSSAIYGAALERMRRIDFSASAMGGEDPTRLGDEWPLDYDEFRAYYRRAEGLFEVAGTRDPDDPDDDATLVPPPALSERDQDFFESFQSVGMKPYRMHVGIAYRPGCRECLSLPCPTDCKADGSSKALCPALRDHGAKILLNCAVERLEATGARVTAVAARTAGRALKFRGRVVVLAAGALSTPLLLRKSTSPQWPSGLGNQNDLVGRGLMFHATDLIALWPRKRLSAAGPRKTLSSRTFYVKEGRKVGSFQSLGLPVSQGTIFNFLMGRIETYSRVKIPLARLFTRAVAIAATGYFKRACVFATIIEDFPYWSNRVVLDPDKPSGFYIEYVKSQELSDRIAEMRSMLKSTLAVHKPWILTGDDNMNLGHPSGTCRFGKDSATSVLDPSNRVRGVENLYVADASFFPSSAGANPGLTVAANSLRVADLIASRSDVHEHTVGTFSSSSSASATGFLDFVGKNQAGEKFQSRWN